MTDILAYAATGKELHVMDALAEAAIPYWRGIRIDFERRGKSRIAQPYTYPVLQNYLWITTDDLYPLSSIKHLSRTMQFLTPGSVKEFQAFANKADAAATEALRIAGNRELIAQYKAGETIRITAGAFEGQFASFKALVNGPHLLHPMIRAEVQIFGRATQVDVDPLNTAKALT